MVASFAKKMMAAAFLAMHHAISSSTATGAEITEAPHQLLTPTLHAQELFHHVDNSWWNLELKAASEEVDRRRRLRQYRKQRKLRQEDDQQQQEREMQSSKNCLSSLQRWFVSLIETIGMDTWEELNYYNVTSLTYLYKHHVSSSLGQNEYFGTWGESTTQLKETHESLKRFWTLGSSSNNNGYGDVSYAASPNLVGGPSNVVLLGMHGSDLSHKAKLVPTLQQLYMLDAPTAMTLADKIQSIIRKLPDSFNNPVLTANALAIQSPHSDGSNNERDSIIIGDGVFEFLDWLQLLDSGSGSNYIQAHEFAHHLQYDLGMMKKNSGLGLNSKAEETRRLELMADMFGSYYLAHSHGGHNIMMGNGDTTTNNALLNEVHRAAFSMGDCESGIATHHGSPRQRECASKYGANLAIKFGGGILSPVKLMNMFDSKLDDILDLTAEECRDESVFDSTFGGQASNNGGGAVVGASSSPGGTNNAGGYWWDKSPLEEAVEDLHIPTFGVAPPSADIDWSSWDSSSSTESWGSENSGWGGGATTFEWYPEEEDSSADNPPAKVGDDKFFSSNNDDWFGNSQWVAGSRATNSGISNGIHASLGAALLCLLGYIMM